MIVKKIPRQILVALLIILTLVCVYFAFFNDDRDCLEESAVDYCQGKDLIYSGTNAWPPMFFFCYVVDDQHQKERFSFTNEELDSCERIKFRERLEQGE